jgi:hypothetical protein
MRGRLYRVEEHCVNVGNNRLLINRPEKRVGVVEFLIRIQKCEPKLYAVRQHTKDRIVCVSESRFLYGGHSIRGNPTEALPHCFASTTIRIDPVFILSFP